jgi:demethylmenaquinone methyltransferase / 2-methoxy-6-polyprenyl-1,4-benzoquinol methylase
MGAVLSLGQDARWRSFMVSRVNAIPGSWVLDVASGTGLVARELAARRNVRVVSLDQSEAMLRAGLEANRRGFLDGQISPVLGEAERMPFPDGTFDSVTCTYLLRYVDDLQTTLVELARVLRRGGMLASLEFLVPEEPLLHAGWHAYTRFAMPAIGRVVSGAWAHTGRFLGPSITEFYLRYPLPEQVRIWQAADLHRIRTRQMSLGAGIVIWGLKGELPSGD